MNDKKLNAAELRDKETEAVSGGFGGDSDYTVTHRQTCSYCGYILREFVLPLHIVIDLDYEPSECPQCHKRGPGRWEMINNSNSLE